MSAPQITETGPYMRQLLDAGPKRIVFPNGRGTAEIGKIIQTNTYTGTTVYQGQWRFANTLSGREIIIKKISLPHADHPDFDWYSQRALTEYQLSRIAAENGVGPWVYGFTRKDNAAYLAIEFISGPVLNEMTPKMLVSQVLTVAEDILEGLSLFHDPHPHDPHYGTFTRISPPQSTGVSHVRHADIKRANIMLYHGKWVLIDWGISGEEIRSDNPHQPTTLGYVSPEQMRAGLGEGSETYSIGISADVYSLSVVLWELLAGISHKTFLLANPKLAAGLQYAPLAHARYLNDEGHRKDMLAFLQQQRRDVPQELLNLLYIGLSPNPHERFANAGEMLRYVKDIRRKTPDSYAASRRWSPPQATVYRHIDTYPTMPLGRWRY